MTISVSTVVNAILPLFIIMMIGVAIRKIGVIDWQTTKKLSSFVVNVTHPFLIIASFQTDVSSEKLIIAVEIIAASIVLHVGFSILARFLFKNSEKADKATLEFGLVFGNCAFLGFPILKAVFPENGLFYGAVFSLVFNIYIRIYGVYLLNRGKRNNRALRDAFLNPGTLASALGLAAFIFSIKLTPVLYDTFTMMGDLTFPLSMIAVGSLLCNQPLKKLFSKKLYVFSFAKLILVPVLVLTACLVFFVDKGMTYLCVIMAAMPTAANTALFSEIYKTNSSLAASCVGLTSLFSVLTIPAMVGLTDFIMELIGR